MTTSTAAANSSPRPDLAARRVPPMGGFNLAFVRLEIRRLLRNRRTLFFTVAFPPLIYLVFGRSGSNTTDSVGHGNVTAYVMVSLAMYGAMLATTSGGAMVAIERAAGWSRQLRLTPLSPIAYIAIKIITAMTLGLVPVVITFAIGRATGARMDSHLWLELAAIAWVGSIVFAAFGLFMGYLLPSENVMQFLGPILGILAFAGGIFEPLSQMSTAWQDIAKFIPTYGLGQIIHAPLTGDSLHVVWLVNLFVWLAIFVVGAGWRFRKDTARV